MISTAAFIIAPSNCSPVQPFFQSAGIITADQSVVQRVADPLFLREDGDGDEPAGGEDLGTLDQLGDRPGDLQTEPLKFLRVGKEHADLRAGERQGVDVAVGKDHLGVFTGEDLVIVTAGLDIFRAGRDGDFNSIFERADQRMYEKKKYLKSIKTDAAPATPA